MILNEGKSINVGLATPIEGTNFEMSLFSVVAIAFAIMASAQLLHLLYKSRQSSILARPAFQISLLATIIFAWPLTIFASFFQQFLHSHWFFLTAIYGFIFSSLGWVHFTPNLNLKTSGIENSEQDAKPGSLPTWLAVIFALGASGYYLREVDFRCTGLAALLFDPEMALVAREVSVKFVKNGLATWMQSLAVSTLVPIALPLVSVAIIFAVKKLYVARALLLTFLFLGLFGLIMLSGAKGAIIPSLIVLLVFNLYSQKKLTRKIAGAFAIFFVFAFCVVGLEMIKEQRSFLPQQRYPFGQCVQNLRACEDGFRLVASMESRRSSLGISDWRAKVIEKDLNLNCTSGERPPPEKSENYDKYRIYSAETFLGRVWTYSKAILRRALVVPIQVASWHFDYSDRNDFPGAKSLPLARHFLGERVTDMPVRIHDEYGIVYSGGARVSTSNSPTSFFVSMSAYLGWSGLLLALIATIVFDFLAAKVFARMPYTLMGVGAGLAAVSATNLMLTDFETVMLSHGALVGLAILSLIGLLATKGNKLIKHSGTRK